jgi:hypothetical protein
MTAVKLREWRGVKPVPGPSGAAITTRLRTTPEDDTVLDAWPGISAACVVQTWHMFAARQAVPSHRGRHPHRSLPQPAYRAGQQTRHPPARGQSRLHVGVGRPALAQAVRERHPLRGSRHRDRASRPRLQGPASGRCDTRATGGSRRESYQPGWARSVSGDQQPPPAQDARNRISPARPEWYAAIGPGNRYPGTGQHWPSSSVTV